MKRLKGLMRRIEGLFVSRERELHDELESNIQLHIDDNRRAGMTAQEARRAALIKFGSIETAKAEWRDQRSIPFLETLARDLTYAMRVLRQNKGWTAIVIGTLALSIGASAAVFSVANAVLFRPLPYEEPDRIAVLLHRQNEPVSPKDYLYWRGNAKTFSRLAAAEAWTPNLTGRDWPEQIRSLRVTDNLFALLGADPMLGRTFSAGEDAEAALPVVVLSYRLWQRRFGGDPGILDQSLNLDGLAYRVIGVMPPEFEFPLFWMPGSEMWAPLKLERRSEANGRSLRIFGRLAEGVTFGGAQSEMDVIAEQLAKAFPSSNTDLPISIFSFHEKTVGDVRTMLQVLLASVGLLLLICCTNLAGMFLARAAARRQELGLRQALGAHRSRIVIQLLIEAAAVVFAGGLAGLAIAHWSIQMFLAYSGPDMLPRQGSINVDYRSAVFSFAVCLLATIASGLLPALKASRTDLNTTLKSGSRSGKGGVHGSGLRRVLVSAEVALAVVLLVGAGLMIRTVAALQASDPGFDQSNTLTMSVSVAGTSHSPEGRRLAFFDELIGRIEAMPGMESVSAINHLPLYGDRWVWPLRVEGRPAPAPGQGPAAVFRVVRPGYFRTMRIPLNAGRDFNDSDNLQAPRVVIINETMAREHWPGGDAIGRRMRLVVGGTGPWLTVVGVARDAKNSDWKEPAEAEMYLPFLQSREFMSNPAPYYSYLTIVARTTDNSEALSGSIKELVWQIDPNAPVSDAMTLEQIESRLLSYSTVPALLLGFFAVVALILAMGGVYGIMSYAVTVRTPEFGIRIALGAKPRSILHLTLRDGFKLAGAGAIAGLIGARFMTRIISNLLYGVEAGDAITFAAVAFLLVLVSLSACLIPAIRAARVDPMESLRLL